MIWLNNFRLLAKAAISVLHVCIILYADDIILLAPSVTALQSLLDTCEDELYYLDMLISSSKSKYIRFGPRYKNTYANITTRDGKSIEWVGSCRYPVGILKYS